jgi:hypothetical protein
VAALAAGAEVEDLDLAAAGELAVIEAMRVSAAAQSTAASTPTTSSAASSGVVVQEGARQLPCLSE